MDTIKPIWLHIRNQHDQEVQHWPLIWPRVGHRNEWVTGVNELVTGMNGFLMYSESQSDLTKPK